MNIADTLHDRPVADLDLSRYVAVPAGASMQTTVEAMNRAQRSSAFVMADDALVGVVTQRDILTDVIGDSAACSRSVEEVMTASPRTINPDDSVAHGMAVMTEEWVRTLPVVADDGTVAGNLSFYTVMRLVADLLSERASRDEPELSAQHGLMFVDFTGLNLAAAGSVGPQDTVETVVHLMKSRALASILVVDEREHVLGTVSEFDLQTKVACQRSDLDQIAVPEVMTADPVTLSVRSPVADAVVRMAESQVSSVALVGESGRLVGLASFRQVVDYFESSLSVLG